MTPRSKPALLPRLNALTGVLGLVLVAASLVAMTGDGAAGADPASDGSDWGGQGTLTSDSAVTVRWDNVGNPPASTVPRDQRQVLPHTGGRTYASLPRPIQDAVAADVGPDNGLGGLRVTVSQTEGLVNQAVTIQIEGVDPDIPSGRLDSRSFLQVFQCWGVPDAAGGVDAAAPGPDPATCQTGAGGADARDISARRNYRLVTGDPLTRDGDWAGYAEQGTEVPFRAITGEESGPNRDNLNTFFNQTTTNELSDVRIPASGSTARQFEVQTTVESQGLGCGKRTDATSTATCWLVVVPRHEGIYPNLGPTSPSVWAQRVQVPLHFRDIEEGCPTGRARSLLGGSEMLADAAASWTPGLCSERQISLGYSRYGDEVARNQFVAGASGAVLTSDPVPERASAVHVPLAIAAPVIGLTVDYRPRCSSATIGLEDVDTEAEARECGWPDLATFRADVASAGRPLRDVRLNARLVAKLLTQSYQSAMLGCASGCDVRVQRGEVGEWALGRPMNLFADPEFRALNPDLRATVYANVGSDLMVEGMRSDAAAQVWRWLLADPGASSFLAGCPDPWDVTINPFYSTRSYAGCEFRARGLERQAAADREPTAYTPRTYVDQPMSYPPLGSPYPLPGWQEEPATESRTARTLVDAQPRVDAMRVAAYNAFIGYQPRNTEWCPTVVDDTCLPAPGKWKALKNRAPVGGRVYLTITDTASAARFQLPTAQLCDEDGAHCVGADTASLQAAAGRFEDTGVPGVVGPTSDDALDAGAYPLTLPIYAAVDPTLPKADRDAYATSFEYVTTRGQQPGFASGDLPPGYAPLTPALRDRARTAIAALRAGVPVEEPTDDEDPSESAEPTDPATSTAPTPTTPTQPTASMAGSAPAVPDVSTPPSAAPSATPPTGATSEAAMLAAASGTESWPGYTFALGLVLALGAGIAGPLMRSRTRWRLR